MNAHELLERLNQTDETERIEAKRAREIGKSILETICAFANAPDLGGGWLLLGVVQDEAQPSPCCLVPGVSNPDKLSADLASQCSSEFNQPLRVEISTQMLGNKPVLVVFVPETDARDKPVYFRKTGLPKGAFRRMGSSDQHCTEDDLEFFYQARGRESFDAGPVPDAEWADFDQAAIDDYRKARSEANPDAEELRWDDAELLQSLKAVRRNTAGLWKPAVAGFLLFGKSNALRREFPMMRVDYIRVPGHIWQPQPGQRFDSMELRAPLFNLLRRTMAAIIDDLPKTFGLEEGALQRSETPIIPQRALREAVVNALMHRSYRTAAPVQVIRYSDRLEIRNPGASLKAPEHLGEPGSIARNPLIAAVLHETRLAETKGSGIRAMREAMNNAGLLPPRFESDRGRDIFVAAFLLTHFLSQQDIDWLARFQKFSLSDEEARALVFVRKNGKIKNANYRDLNQVDVLTASAALRRLRDVGLLSQHGGGPATWYQAAGPLIGDDGAGDGQIRTLSRETGALSSELGALSSELGTLSSEPGALSSEPGTLSSELGPAARNALLDQLPVQLVARVGALGQRHPKERVRDLIVELCRLQAWKSEEIALMLSRNHESVRQNYLRPLLKQRRIEMTLPDTPNSPLQAYRSVEHL